MFRYNAVHGAPHVMLLQEIWDRPAQAPVQMPLRLYSWTCSRGASRLLSYLLCCTQAPCPRLQMTF